MDIGAWDWSAIATFFTSFIALGIYSNWRKQKAAEVLSIEAKNFLLIITDYRNQLITLHSKIMNHRFSDCNKELIEPELNELISVLRNLRNFDSFFDELNGIKISGDSIFFKECCKFLSEVRKTIAGFEEPDTSKYNLFNTNNEFSSIIERLDSSDTINEKRAELISIFKYSRR